MRGEPDTSAPATAILRVLIPAKTAGLSWDEAWTEVVARYGRRVFQPSAMNPGEEMVNAESMLRFLHRTMRAAYLDLPTGAHLGRSLLDEPLDADAQPRRVSNRVYA